MAVFARLALILSACLAAAPALAQFERDGPRAPRADRERGMDRGIERGERARPGPGRNEAGKADKTEKEKEPRKPRLTREQTLNELYDRLAKAQDEEEGKGVATAIERVFLRSGSDTADLLMTRAVAAAHRNNGELAEDLVDRILLIEPDWAEAWHRRATLRAAREDISGALADLAEALKREPRHIGAMAGLGFLMLKQEQKAQGLKALRRLLELHPQMTQARKAVEKLGLEIDGQAL